MQAQELIKDGKISIDMAVKSLRFAKQNHLELEEAITVLGSVHKKTMVVSSITNDLTRLMMEAGMITQEQLGRALTRASESQMQMGHILVLNRDPLQLDDALGVACINSFARRVKSQGRKPYRLYKLSDGAESALNKRFSN